MEGLVNKFAGRKLDQEEFKSFADKFRDQYIESFGTGHGGKDRGDRSWGWKKITGKMSELHIAAQIREDKQNHTFLIALLRKNFEN